MKKIKFIVSKCVNNRCGFYCISEFAKKECPLCKSKMLEDRKHLAEGFDDEINDDAFIGFRKNGNYKRRKNTKTKK